MFPITPNTSRSAAGPLKKPRVLRACDICRKKKSRCDGVEATGKPCTQCAEYDFECTYLEPAKKRGRPRSYVESLENRIEQLEKIIQRLCPNDIVYKEIIQALDTTQWTEHAEVYQKSSGGSGTASSFVDGGVNARTTALSGVVSGEETSDDEDDINNILADSLKRMQLEPPEYRFLGRSSGLMLIRTALDLKNSHNTPGQPPPGLDKKKANRDGGRATMKHIRMEYWMPLPWELHTPHVKTSLNTSFPEPDLASHLIDIYFRHMNVYLPLLHRPTFMKWVNERGLMTLDGGPYSFEANDDHFVLVYLLVCAVGARYSDDPRCLLDDVPITSPHATHSNGWRWFHQALALAGRKNVINPPTLFDIQFYALAAQFLVGSSAPQAAWTLIGFGVRVAQDVGAHRKKINPHGPSAEEEMLKRAFWTLVCMDGIVSASFGRACAIYEEDFDLDLPIDCDDEYWNVDHPNPDQRFKQPKDKPSLIAAFIILIKLNGILTLALRTIYAMKKSTSVQKIVGTPSEQTVVAELDSTLNKFADSIPNHLKWDPANPSDIFFTQSASLYSLYYHVQILVHRSFIPSPTKPSPVSMPSMAVCTNAARSCCRIVESVRKRGVYVAPEIQMAVFTSAMVLLLSIWESRLTGLSALSSSVQRDMEDVHKCMEVLRASESRWHIMGRLWDIVYELASAGDLLPKASPTNEIQEENFPRNHVTSPHDASVFQQREHEHGALSFLTQPLDGIWTPRASQHSPSYVGAPHDSLSSSSEASIRSSSFNTPLLPRGRDSTDPPFPTYSIANTPLSDSTTHPNSMINNTLSPFFDAATDILAPKSTSFNPKISGLLRSEDSLDSSIVRRSKCSDRGAESQLPFGGSDAMFQYDMPSLQQHQSQNELWNSNIATRVGYLDPASLQNLFQNLQDSSLENQMLAPHFSDFAIEPQPESHLQDERASARFPSAAGTNLDLMSMWSNAPDGFRLEEWDAYLTSIGEIMYPSQGAPSHPRSS